MLGIPDGRTSLGMLKLTQDRFAAKTAIFKAWRPRGSAARVGCDMFRRTATGRDRVARGIAAVIWRRRLPTPLDGERCGYRHRVLLPIRRHPRVPTPPPSATISGACRHGSKILTQLARLREQSRLDVPSAHR